MPGPSRSTAYTRSSKLTRRSNDSYPSQDAPRSGARPAAPRPAHDPVPAASAISWRPTPPAPNDRPKKLVYAVYAFSSNAAFSDGVCLATGAVLITLGQTAASSSVASVKQVHNWASEPIVHGDKSVDAPVPRDLRDKYESTFGVKTHKKPTDREVLQKSEDDLTKRGLTVRVAVDAAPDHCSVTYKAVAMKLIFLEAQTFCLPAEPCAMCCWQRATRFGSMSSRAGTTT